MRTLVQSAPAPPRKGDAREQREYVTALARGLEVIRAFAGQDEELTLAEIAKIVDLPRATVRRSLITLEALGYIEEKGRFFRLAPKVLTLAQAYLSSNLLPRVANPFVQQVSADLGLVVAAMHVTTQASRTTKRQMIDRFLPALRKAATDMRGLLV
jgi:DNA-binding IclR family transcriptional regulator